MKQARRIISRFIEMLKAYRMSVKVYGLAQEREASRFRFVRSWLYEYDQKTNGGQSWKIK